MKHSFEFVVFAGGWEALECSRCGRGEIPSPFGFMWSDLRIVQWLFPHRRCTGDK